ncbi:MAG: hypothetical protein ABIJ28_00015 [Patescibacteria group bacterium]
MPEKEIRPKQGEFWRWRSNCGQDSLFFVYYDKLENETSDSIFLMGIGTPERIIPSKDRVSIVDGRYGWKRVYALIVPMTEEFFK